MNHYKPSSELQRVVEESLRNAERLQCYREKQTRYIVEHWSMESIQLKEVKHEN